MVDVISKERVIRPRMTIRCGNEFCGDCNNVDKKKCVIFDVRLRAYSGNLRRCEECIKAERPI